MTDERWDRLDALAAAATPGPREADMAKNGHWDVVIPGEPKSEDRETWLATLRGPNREAEAAFIAACDPATIRDLVAAARERDELRAAAAAAATPQTEAGRYLWDHFAPAPLPDAQELHRRSAQGRRDKLLVGILAIEDEARRAAVEERDKLREALGEIAEYRLAPSYWQTDRARAALYPEDGT